ncbi:hypothetical protein [Bifidobacterium stellenboschense]|uniref:Uncharacterized protein n=1 Tax=Bifidobacterium stellenboschense TaxID=762211 RepID=A0A087DNA6_9BIFI|nr:hypothetical protein [Bifidobacterium stellenboschense]KFI97006.1 hypothetical protein BSTEL_1917 [Bifidobacterium stellenboschense]
MSYESIDSIQEALAGREFADRAIGHDAGFTLHATTKRPRFLIMATIEPHRTSERNDFGLPV